MLSAHEVAKWFIFNNPELASGFIDENTKVNKLLYFSNLLYYCVNGENLISDDFVAFPNGPVVYSVYRDYRYNGLNSLPPQKPQVAEKQQKFLEIVNFVYGNLSTSELVEESHSHSLWKNVQHLIPNNPKVDFENIESELVSYNKALFQTYSELDFSKIVKEKICGNVYYYFEDSLVMTDEIVNQLSLLGKWGEPKFLDMIGGELVIS